MRPNNTRITLYYAVVLQYATALKVFSIVFNFSTAAVSREAGRAVPSAPIEFDAAKTPD